MLGRVGVAGGWGGWVVVCGGGAGVRCLGRVLGYGGEVSRCC